MRAPDGVVSEALRRWPEVGRWVWSDEAKVLPAKAVVAEIERRWPGAHEAFMGAFCPWAEKEGIKG